MINENKQKQQKTRLKKIGDTSKNRNQDDMEVEEERSDDQGNSEDAEQDEQEDDLSEGLDEDTKQKQRHYINQQLDMERGQNQEDNDKAIITEDQPERLQIRFRQ